jgi:hypothetical protein
MNACIKTVKHRASMEAELQLAGWYGPMCARIKDGSFLQIFHAAFIAALGISFEHTVLHVPVSKGALYSQADYGALNAGHRIQLDLTTIEHAMGMCMIPITSMKTSLVLFKSSECESRWQYIKEVYAKVLLDQQRMHIAGMRD